MSDFDMNSVLSTLDVCLDLAGEILMKYHGRLEGFELKGHMDLVTVADKESEKAIVERILAAHPDHGILGEEGSFCQPGACGVKWIIDPLDGTTNFTHGMPLFAVSIGIELDGEIVAGGVFNPFMKEKFTAWKGGGSFLNGKPIGVSKVKALKESLVVSGFPYDRNERADHYLSGWKAMLTGVHGVLRLGSAALDLAYVAAGRIDGFWEERLNPWDTAAGYIILKEAGGMVTDFSGKEYSVYQPELLASNGLIQEEMRRVLLSGWEVKG